LIYNTYQGQSKDKVRQLSLRQSFGKELKQRVQDREHLTVIGQWIDRYHKGLANLDNNFLELLQKLSLMSVGFNNRRSYEELNQIADKLIAGIVFLDIYFIRPLSKPLFTAPCCKFPI
jgi:hypothetical protein